MMDGGLVLHVHSDSGDIGKSFLLLADIVVESVKTSKEPFIPYLFSDVSFKKIMSRLTMVSDR